MKLAEAARRRRRQLQRVGDSGAATAEREGLAWRRRAVGPATIWRCWGQRGGGDSCDRMVAAEAAQWQRLRRFAAVVWCRRGGVGDSDNREDGGSVSATRRRRQCQRRWLQCKAPLQCSTRCQQRVCSSASRGSRLAAARGGVGGSENRKDGGSLVTTRWQAAGIPVTTKHGIHRCFSVFW